MLNELLTAFRVFVAAIVIVLVGLGSWTATQMYNGNLQVLKSTQETTNNKTYTDDEVAEMLLQARKHRG